jgi:hypothetical protein
VTLELRPPRREDAEAIAAATREFGYRSGAGMKADGASVCYEKVL